MTSNEGSTMQNVRIEGIRLTNSGTWVVVGTRTSGQERGATVLVSEHRGPGSKARAIQEAGTNRAA